MKIVILPKYEAKKRNFQEINIVVNQLFKQSATPFLLTHCDF